MFGFLHAWSYSSAASPWIGVLNASLLAAALSIGVIRSHSLMWALGFHWAWNLSQVGLLAAQDGGPRSVVTLRIIEGVWMGSSAVPESGLMITWIVVVFGVYASRRFSQVDMCRGWPANE